MVIVTGLIMIDPADVETLRAAGIAVMEATAHEPGCLHYRFSEDIGRPGHIRIYEEWESEAALAAHLKAPHVAVWREALKDIRILGRAVKVVTVAGERPL
jgi:quinol monooxygenase YgiN